MTSEATYTRHDGQEAAAALDSFIPAYGEIYVEPPYREGPRDVAEFIEHYAVQVRRPGMRLVLAHDGDEVVGFAYGYYLAADTRWWQNIQGVALPEAVTWEDGRRTLVVIELAVRKAWRRRGIAAALHTRLLDDAHAQRVTLTVRPEPEAAAAQEAYAAWGYRKIGVSRPWDDAPLYDCMVRDLDD
ncbi:GNAT family N-acetyltransferase [Streptomyces sp. AC512_CC834]|uniref:GNAT family N-acetyltransferase n=1 Tax=Streptomyces sp. AC512_CC834 TaxID=2823691 RepID=UPI001C279D76|nr:GNAT family N-acetyltransferase [Streptomyces sp. AC512_CC834]